MRTALAGRTLTLPNGSNLADFGKKITEGIHDLVDRTALKNLTSGNPLSLTGTPEKVAKVEVNGAMTGTTPSAWNDPTRGGELAKAQFAKGVDVIFAAAGGTGVGVYQAAKDAGKLAIGVDSNQNHLHPGTMLTSMVKRVDVAVTNLFKKTNPGAVTVLGLKEGGVDYALDKHNEKLVTADMKKKVDAAKADIIAGKIKVADYMADNACKY